MRQQSRICLLFILALLCFPLLELKDKPKEIALDSIGINEIFFHPKEFSIHFLIPYTVKSDLISCEKFFDYDKNFKEALDCFNTKVYPKDPLKDVKLPNCYVIKESTSPDVIHGKEFNFITTSILMFNQIVGFYEHRDDTVYLVENFDVEKIARHELGHYFLDLKEDNADGLHIHNLWSKCEPPYYDPSPESIENQKNKLKN